MNATNSDLSQHIKTPVLITEKEKLDTSPRKYKVKKIKNFKQIIENSKNYEKIAKKIFFENQKPPQIEGTKRTKTICNNIVNKIVNRDTTAFNVSYNMHNIDCLAMDRFIRKIDSERKEKLSKSNRMKGSVYKIKKKKILIKKLLRE